MGHRAAEGVFDSVFMVLVADHATELSLAKEHIANLESIQTTQRAEVSPDVCRCVITCPLNRHLHFCSFLVLLLLLHCAACVK